MLHSTKRHPIFVLSIKFNIYQLNLPTSQGGVGGEAKKERSYEH
jgi:hypothetical protein